MGFVDQAARTLKANHKLLKGKTLFRKLAKGKTHHTESKIDPERLNRVPDLIRKRTNERFRVVNLIVIPLLIIITAVFIIEYLLTS